MVKRERQRKLRVHVSREELRRFLTSNGGCRSTLFRYAIKFAREHPDQIILPERRTIKLDFRLPQEDYAWLRALAKQHRVSQQAILRAIFSTFLENLSKEEPVDGTGCGGVEQ